MAGFETETGESCRSLALGPAVGPGSHTTCARISGRPSSSTARRARSSGTEKWASETHLPRNRRAPRREVADEIPPAPALKRDIEREGLAAVVTDRKPESDHLVVVEDRRAPPLSGCALCEPLRQIHPHACTLPLAVQTEASVRADSKMLSGKSGQRGGNGRHRTGLLRSPTSSATEMGLLQREIYGQLSSE